MQSMKFKMGYGMFIRLVYTYIYIYIYFIMSKFTLNIHNNLGIPGSVGMCHNNFTIISGIPGSVGWDGVFNH